MRLHGAGNPNLTPREREVGKLLALDLSNREIAARLSISVNTVPDHVNAVRRKTKSRTRLGAAVKFALRERVSAARARFVIRTVKPERQDLAGHPLTRSTDFEAGSVARSAEIAA